VVGSFDITVSVGVLEDRQESLVADGEPLRPRGAAFDEVPVLRVFDHAAQGVEDIGCVHQVSVVDAVVGPHPEACAGVGEERVRVVVGLGGAAGVGEQFGVPAYTLPVDAIGDDDRISDSSHGRDGVSPRLYRIPVRQRQFGGHARLAFVVHLGSVASRRTVRKTRRVGEPGREPCAARPADDTVDAMTLGSLARTACVAALVFTAACDVPNPPKGQVAGPKAGLASAVKSSGRYGPDSTFHRYDLYRPASPRFRETPLVIFVHGGAWAGGSRAGDLHAFAGPVTALVDHGWAVASIDYRLTRPAGSARAAAHPAQVHDVVRAVRWFKTNGAALGLDASTVILSGHSAGGHLAALAATSCTGTRQRATCDSLFEPTPSAVNSRVDGLITLAPVIDVGAFGRANVLGSREAVNDFLGCSGSAGVCNPSLARQLNPLVRLDPSDPPWYLAHGTGDSIVAYAAHTEAAYARARSVLGDRRVWLDAVEGVNHDLPGVNAAAVVVFAERVRTRKL
jgi:acetyl esterase/lipase